MNPLVVAARGKGVVGAARRAIGIGRRYGLTVYPMEQALARFVAIVREGGSSATLPITATALERHPGVVEQYSDGDIEFAVHGYNHVDHTRLDIDYQVRELIRARELFLRRGLAADGFRAPYLRTNSTTLEAVRKAGFAYDASRAISFPIPGGLENEAYRHALDFEQAQPDTASVALPLREHGIWRLPYALPDDEALVERLRVASPGLMTDLWLRMLARTHETGELLTLGLHPERLLVCEDALKATLVEANRLRPAVWTAPLHRIADWWIARSAAKVTIMAVEPGRFHIVLDGPPGVRAMARGMDVLAETRPWSGSDVLVDARAFDIRCDRRPVVSVSPRSSPELVEFLQAAGYPIETTAPNEEPALVLDRPAFTASDQRALLDELAGHPGPLIHLARWPDGARSALCVSGDIDALTIGDYALRFVGH